jgi:NAD(P)-dependent dehydrogenase (short-subunit alcohol dehydrogenase family)
MKAIVTGASDGIGGAIALQLAADCAARAEGLDLVLTASGRKPAPQALLGRLDAAGARTAFLTGDLADPAACADLAARALDTLGGLDAFVSNAGASVPHKLAELSVADWDRTFAVNTRPTFVLAQAFRPALSAARGRIVAVAPMSGLRPHTGLGVYSAAKAALIMLCRVLAQEWAADGIRVNAVAPGMIRTPLTERIYQHPEVKARREALVPLGRIGTPADIAGVVAFLAGPGAAYVTGQVLLADGGIADSALGAIPGLPAS